MAQDIVMVVGLGNPGADYEHTRHNAGALFVEALARAAGQALRPERKYHGLYARIQWQGLDLHLLNPTTFMNRSGLAIKALADFFKIQPHQILIAHDELDLPPGTAKLKKGGGHGGHNGLRDLIRHLDSNDFVRLRLGIGHPGHPDDVTDYVLHAPPAGQRSAILDAVSRAVALIEPMINGDHAAVMNELHRADD